MDLTDTQLGSKGGLVIAQLLRNNTTLQKLNLTNNAIGTKGMKAIVPELTTNSSLQVLNLSYNNIKARGATLLANALEEPTSVCNLKSLNHAKSVDSCHSVSLPDIEQSSDLRRRDRLAGPKSARHKLQLMDQDVTNHRN